MLYRVRVWFGTRQCYSYLSDWFNYDCLVFNKLRPRQNGCNFSDDISNCIFWNENGWISITISLKFVPKGPIDNIPPLIRIMAWCWPGDKPLSEPMMDNLLTHICVSRTQWVKVNLVMNHDDVIKWKHIRVVGLCWANQPACGTEFCCFLWSAPQQTIELPVVWEAMALFMALLQCVDTRFVSNLWGHSNQSKGEKTTKNMSKSMECTVEIKHWANQNGLLQKTFINSLS